jgi:hypothetical protein
MRSFFPFPVLRRRHRFLVLVFKRRFLEFFAFINLAMRLTSFLLSFSFWAYYFLCISRSSLEEETTVRLQLGESCASPIIIQPNNLRFVCFSFGSMSLNRAVYCSNVLSFVSPITGFLRVYGRHRHFAYYSFLGVLIVAYSLMYLRRFG